MKKRILLLSIVVALVLSIMAVPVAFAESNPDTVIVSFSSVTTPTKTIDIARESGIKSVDMFVGESINIDTDILVSQWIIIEDDSTIKADYIIDPSFETSVTRKVFDTPSIYKRRETLSIKATKAGKYQLIAEYRVNGETYFDNIDINVVDENIESITLQPNVTSVRTGAKVNFDISINGSNTLSVIDASLLNISINDVALDTLKGYVVPSEAKPLNIKAVYNGKEFASTIDVVSATELNMIMTDKENYGYLLKNKQGKIKLYVTKGSYPNIGINTDSATLVDTTMVESDKEGYDLYELTIKFDSEASQESMLIHADEKLIVCKLNIIDTITSVSIMSNDTKFESNKPATFHIIINGVKDVDASVKWSVNGEEQSNTSNTLTYKAISSNDIKVTATVDEVTAEYKYTIDTSTNTIILTVVMSLVVIIICIPILIGLKKSPKPNLKAMITKDNNATIALLKKLKDEFEEGSSKTTIKHILKINTMITRSEKRAQQESFECENKAFGGALSNLSTAKDLISELLSTHKNNPKDVNINIVDNIILSLETSNDIIKKVIDNM